MAPKTAWRSHCISLVYSLSLLDDIFLLSLSSDLQHFLPHLHSKAETLLLIPTFLAISVSSLTFWSLKLEAESLDLFSDYIHFQDHSSLAVTFNIIHSQMTPKYISSSDLCPELWRHMYGCGVDISTWVSKGYVKLNIAKKQFLFTLHPPNFLSFPFQQMPAPSFQSLKPKWVKWSDT